MVYQVFLPARIPPAEHHRQTTVAFGVGGVLSGAVGMFLDKHDGWGSCRL